MDERLNSQEHMQRELEEARPCLRCGESRREHYAGVLRGCRQGRTIFTPGGSIGLYN